MIPRNSQEITKDGSLPGKRTLMTIRPEHMPHIMKLLTNMYSDIILAIIREYSVNALDSHIAAGNTDPIQVRLPDRYHPFFEIEDFGTGMSIDFVENEFSQYGASTKRETNEQAGAYGIGGKSALAYADSFMLTTVQNGVKGVFEISRDEDGAAIITTVDTSSTKDPNGTKVSIPCAQGSDFESKLRWFFKFWESGTVLINGEAPVAFQGEHLAEDIDIVPGGGQSYVIMGNIPYRVANSYHYVSHQWQNIAFVARVPMGALSITPNREALEYGDQPTIEELKRIGKIVNDNMQEKVKNEILDQPDHFTAWERWRKWTQALGGVPAFLEGLEYDGDKFTDSVEAEGYVWSIGKRSSRYSSAIERVGKNAQFYGEKTVKLESLKVVIVKRSGDTFDGHPSAYNKQKIKWYLSDKSIGHNRVYLLDEVPKSPWMKGLKVHYWEDVLKAKNPYRAPGKPRQAAGTVKILSGSYGWEEELISDLPKDVPLLYLTPADVKSGDFNATKFKAALDHYKYDVVVVKLPLNRWDKFKREHKNAESLKTWVEDKVKIESAAVPTELWELRALKTKTASVITRIRPGNLLDKKLAALVNMQKNHVEYEKHWNAVVNLATSYKVNINDIDKTKTEDWVYEKYPLISVLEVWAVSNGTLDALETYFNAEHAKGK